VITEACIQNGSRNADGNVPNMYHNDSKVNVNQNDIHNANANYGVRREVFTKVLATKLLGLLVLCYVFQPAIYLF
jgi:hypothetical protein